jgi:hypothetical protein
VGHARTIHEKTDISSSFEELCGTRDDPWIEDCLKLIFDPGESPPGTCIQESTADIEAGF